MIFQEPMTSLNPVYTIGAQITEAIRLHQRSTRRRPASGPIEMLRRVGIPTPAQRLDDYPHQLRGGMRQRVMIAMALSCNPTLLIADEPTTALDVTIQAQILELMQKLQEEFHMAIMMITHNLGVVAGMADEVAVMYLGQVVEYGRCGTSFKRRRHPYTEGSRAPIPVLGAQGQKAPRPRSRAWCPTPGSCRRAAGSLTDAPSGCPSATGRPAMLEPDAGPLGPLLAPRSRR